MPQDAVGSVVEAVERRDDAPAAQPDEGARSSLSSSSVSSWTLELCLDKEKGGASEVFFLIVTNCINGKFISV